MVYFPNCKINIGLHIISKRKDNFHNLETIFYPIGIYDAVEIIQDDNIRDVVFSSSGNIVGGKEEDNLCLRAYHIIKKDYPHLPPCSIHLHKHIPEKAGLGGGSADASFTLKLLNDKFQLGISIAQLMQYALLLGSDCPFFIHNKPCLATGRGEVLEPFDINLNDYHILIVNPGIAIETKKAFEGITLPEKPPTGLKEQVSQPIENWKGRVNNDFEKPVFEAYPEIGQLKESLYQAGAVYASLSGSGSSVYGIFYKKTPVALPAHYFQKWV